MKNVLPLMLMAILLYSSPVVAQQNTPSVINSSGGSAQSGYYQFEWSVGELALVSQMNAGNLLIVTNGFLQPYTLYPGANHQYNHFSSDEIKVFPVPASAYIEINFLTKQRGRISLSFFDATGKKVLIKELQGNGVDIVERIPLSQFAAGVYALHVDLNAEPGFISKKGMYKIVKVN